MTTPSWRPRRQNRRTGLVEPVVKSKLNGTVEPRNPCLNRSSGSSEARRVDVDAEPRRITGVAVDRGMRIQDREKHRTSRPTARRTGRDYAPIFFSPHPTDTGTGSGLSNGLGISHLLKCRCPRANGMSKGAVGAVNMWSSKSSSLFPWSLFVEDIVLVMWSLLSDRDSVSLPESPELREEYPLQSRPSPPFESAGNESRRASGLDTSGGLVLL